jgi:hypothetical protein
VGNRDGDLAILYRSLSLFFVPSLHVLNSFYPHSLSDLVQSISHSLMPGDTAVQCFRLLTCAVEDQLFRWVHALLPNLFFRCLNGL